MIIEDNDSKTSRNLVCHARNYMSNNNDFTPMNRSLKKLAFWESLMMMELNEKDFDLEDILPANKMIICDVIGAYQTICRRTHKEINSPRECSKYSFMQVHRMTYLK